MDALVTDAQIPGAVAGIRGLGRSGREVLALGPRWSAAGLWSSHASGRAVGPDVDDDPAGFVARVAELAAAHGPLVVYPGREASIDPLLAAWPPLPSEAILPYPHREAVLATQDKGRFGEFARAAGLRTPETLFEGTAGELAERSVRLPAVVKPGAAGGELRSPRRVSSRVELGELAGALPREEALLIQEQAVGPLGAVDLVVDREGRLVQRFQYTTRRTFPPAAGPPSLAVGVAPDELLCARAARMLAEAGYHGLAEIQYVDTPRGATVIDVNARFFGMLPLALASGVNLPAAWHALATGEQPPPLTAYRAGITYRWLEAELTAALRGAPELLTQRAPRPRTGAMWADDDPRGSALLAVEVVSSRVRRRLPARLMRV